MTALLKCLAILLVSSQFHQSTTAISSVDKNRVLLAYNAAFDICKEITDHSGHESKTAANKECGRAFHALDQVKLNTCFGWRYAACRLISPDQPRQCTCIISFCDDHSVKSNVVRSFRDCAPRILAKELATGQIAAPTESFQRYRSYYDYFLQEALSRRAQNDYYGRTIGPSGGYAMGGAGTSSAFYTSGYENPSAAGPSYLAGALMGPVFNAVDEEMVKYPKPHECNKCDGRYRSARALFEHKRVHHTVGDNYCYLCTSPYSSRKTFLAHLQKRHPEIFADEMASPSLPDDVPNREELMPLCCPVCLRRYSSENSLRDHMKSHTTEDTICPACKRLYSTRAVLKVHMKKTHPGVPMPEPAAAASQNMGPVRERDNGPFFCGECGKQYKYKKGLVAHAQSHTTLNTYCILCDATLASPHSYKSHLRIRHPTIAAAESAVGNEQYEQEYTKRCKICPKRFRTNRGLRDHGALHEGRSTCDECTSVLPTKKLLNAHKRKEHPK